VKVLFIGDIVSKAGRRVLADNLVSLKGKHQPDFVIANAENTTHGKGLNFEHGQELLALGIDCLTGGNHSFDQPQINDLFKMQLPVIRPYNFPGQPEGRGFITLEKGNLKLNVLNLLGISVMKEVQHPFHLFDHIAREISDAPILIDFHGEMSSEKNAFVWHVDGRAACVLGTHWHIPTADAKILPKGTGMITDVGMTGAIDSVLGVEPQIIVDRFMGATKKSFEFPKSRAVLRAVVVELADRGQKCLSISQIIVEEQQ